MIYDISRTVSRTTAVWPGDTPYTTTMVMRRGDGASVNLTTLTLSPHTGSHADAYFHYEDEAAYPAHMPLDAYLGRARLVTVTRDDGALMPDDFSPGVLDGVERLLVHSQVSALDDSAWAERFPYLSVALIEVLAAQGTRLIGLDAPSVDAFSSTTLPCHHALRRFNLVNLELLNFSGVPDGDYELIALPLRLDEACASPVRAILRTLV